MIIHLLSSLLYTYYLLLGNNSFINISINHIPSDIFHANVNPKHKHIAYTNKDIRAKSSANTNSIIISDSNNVNSFFILIVISFIII